MKRKFIIKSLSFLLVLILCLSLNATVKEYTNYNYKNFKFHLCYNHTYISRKKLAYYKAVGKLLDNYINLKKRYGEINKNTILEFEIGCAYLGKAPYLEIWKNGNKLSFLLEGKFLRLNELVKIVEYFSSKEWKPFHSPTNEDYEKMREKAFRDFMNLLDKKYSKADWDFFRNKKITVYQVSKLKVYYENENIKISLNGKDLKIPLGVCYPIKIKLKIDT